MPGLAPPIGHIVGGGYTPVSGSSTVGAIPKVVTLVPPTLNDSIMRQASGAIIVGTTDPNSGGSELLRTASGIDSGHATYTAGQNFGRNNTMTAPASGPALALPQIVFGRNNVLTVGTGAGNSLPNVVLGNNNNVAAGAAAGICHGNVVVGDAITLTSTTNAVNQNVVVGRNITQTNAGSATASNVLVGFGITIAAGGTAVALGWTITSNNASAGNILIGTGVQTTGSSSSANVIIGGGSPQSSTNNCVLIGDGTSAGSSALQSVVVGSGSSTLAQASVVVGMGSSIGSTTHTNNLLIGGALNSFQANTCMIGTGNFSQLISTFVFGGNDTSSLTPFDMTFRLVNGQSTDRAGRNWTFQSGAGTGSGAASSFIFQTPTSPAGTSTTLQTLATRFTIATAGLTSTVNLTMPAAAVGTPAINFGTTNTGLWAQAAGAVSISGSGIEYVRVSTGGAGESSLMLYDQTAATLKRVSFGANDSGGAGFKVLRVAN